MRVNLTGKKVLLGVTGSIAIYKAAEVARLLIKSEAQVRIVMTEAAQRFVTPLTFEALTHQTVLTEATESWSSDLNHIDIGKWADLFLIAPATANTLNKLSKGIADNLLLQSALAFGGPLLVAPAANTRMITNPHTEGSLKMLGVGDVQIIRPQTKLLACGDEGNGALADPIEIYWQTAQALMSDPFWQNRKVVVTGGGTRERIDEVRYLSNNSSGKMGKALSTALYLRGADVCYVTTMPHDDLPSEIYTVDVEDGGEMHEYVVDCLRTAKKGKLSKPSIHTAEPVHWIQKTPYLFMAAAVADYAPQFSQEGKLKKDALGSEWSLELTQTVDILKSIDKNDIITVGFKAEMDKENGKANAQNLLVRKGVDAVCFNLLENRESFGTDENQVIFLTPNKEIDLGRHPKLELALNILDESETLDHEKA
jgi:phosphopantothenoylcysteine decarboxylase/phosphopantothenate--cysteine ligase